jgi:hypothetical protein
MHVEVIVNGVRQDEGSDFTVRGGQVDLHPQGLASGDRMHVALTIYADVPQYVTLDMRLP